MNGKEKTTLDVVATDVKWLVKNLEEMKKDVKEQGKSTQKNTTFRKVTTWIGSIFFLTIIGLCVTILTTA